jgi:hypothetical protein
MRRSAHPDIDWRFLEARLADLDRLALAGNAESGERSARIRAALDCAAEQEVAAIEELLQRQPRRV